MSLRKTKFTLFQLAMMVVALGSLNCFASLTPKAVFYRCYKQITQSYPATDHPLIARVSSGALDPIDACLTVFDKARFTANGNKRVGNINDEESLNVLSTMHGLHHSWLTNKNFPIGALSFAEETEAIVDYNGPSLFYTRALFAPNYQFGNIFQGSNEQLESDRTNNSPNVSPLNPDFGKDKFNYKNNTIFAAKGKLLGVRTFNNRSMSYQVGSNNRTVTADFALHWGGGVLGTYAYVAMNVDITERFRANGGILTPRKWGRNIFKDFLCRDLPVVRLSDSRAFVSETSPLSFRQVNGCVVCHASMDRAASVVRTVTSDIHRTQGGTRSLGIHFKLDIDTPEETGWPDRNIDNFWRRPEKGVFYFRDHDGKLINQSVANANELGGAIAASDAPYVCAAKRYYKYFTGIQTNVDDLEDPQYPFKLSESEIKHRAEVIALGKNLKKHQSLRQLVEEILRKPLFKSSSYSLGE